MVSGERNHNPGGPNRQGIKKRNKFGSDGAVEKAYIIFREHIDAVDFEPAVENVRGAHRDDRIDKESYPYESKKRLNAVYKNRCGNEADF